MAHSRGLAHRRPQSMGLLLCSVTLSMCYPSTPSSERHLSEVLRHLSGGSEIPAGLEVQGGSHFHHYCSAKPASSREGWEKARPQRERWALEVGKTHTPFLIPSPTSSRVIHPLPNGSCLRPQAPTSYQLLQTHQALSCLRAFALPADSSSFGSLLHILTCYLLPARTPPPPPGH